MNQLKISQTITVRKETLNSYLADISKLPRITPEEEVELAARIHKGDEQALSDLVVANLRFVVSVAKQYQSAGMDLCDLISEGNIGLIKAAQRYDETKGFKFISFAVWWIRQSIIAAISDKGRTVRLPLNKIGEISKITKAKFKFIQTEGREPTPEEISNIVSIPVDKVKEALGLSGGELSVDAPIGEDGDGSLLDIMSDNSAPATDASVEYESLKTDLDEALVILNGRDRDIIKMSFGIGYPEQLDLETIAEKLEISKERVRQLRDNALRRLRRSKYSENLIIYLR